jgi:hypothetical protein
VLNGKGGCSDAGGGLEVASTESPAVSDDSAAIGYADRLEGSPCGLERFDRSASVDRHQSRVRDNIRGEDGGESKTKFRGPHGLILDEFKVV